jgi:hypothetical protein
MPTNPPTLSVAEAAAATGFSRQAIHRAVKDGRLSRFLIRDAAGRCRLMFEAVAQIRGGLIRQRVDTGRPAPPPRPAPEPEAAFELEAEPDEFTGDAEVADLLQQIEQWHALVQELENLVAWWEGEYSDFRGWITAKAAGSVLDTLEEHPAARHAVCETVAAVQKKLRAGLDEVHIKTTV